MFLTQGALRNKDEGKDVTLPILFDLSTIKIRPEARDQGSTYLICHIRWLKLNEKSRL